MPVIYKSKGDYIPFVDPYGASTLDMLKTNLLFKVYQKTKDKYCNFTFGCGWNDETWGSGVYYGTSIVVSTTTDNREFFIVFYPSEASTGLNLLGTAYLLDGRTPVYVRYIERSGTATWHIENVNKNENNICQTVVGMKNYTGHQINSGEYFIANGEKYKATAAIPNGSSWQGSATAVSDYDLINALNSKVITTESNLTVNVGTNFTSYGWGGSKVRKIGSVLIYTLAIASAPTTAKLTTLATIPDGFKPISSRAFGSGGTGRNGDEPVTLIIDTSRSKIIALGETKDFITGTIVCYAE